MTFKSKYECVQVETWMLKENVNFLKCSFPFFLKLLKKKIGLFKRLWTTASAQSDVNFWLVSVGPKHTM